MKKKVQATWKICFWDNFPSSWDVFWKFHEWAFIGVCACVKLLQSCPTLCNPVDCSLAGSSVHGILQARILEWVAISSSRGIFPTQGSNPHLLHWQMDSLSLGHLGVPCLINTIFIYSYYHSVYGICPFKFFFFSESEMLDSWSHWLTLAQESRHKCPCVYSGASEADWGASDEMSALLPSCWWNQGASERTTERINQLTRFCTATSMSWALGLVWLEGGGEDKLPLTQKSEGISGFHLWSKAPMITGFMQLVLNPFKG